MAQGCAFQVVITFAPGDEEQLIGRVWRMPQTKMVFIYKVIATESEMDIYVTDLAGQKAVVLKTLMDRIRRRDEDGVLWIPFRHDCRFVSLVTHSRPNSRQPKTTDNQGFTHVIKSSRRSFPRIVPLARPTKYAMPYSSSLTLARFNAQQQIATASLSRESDNKHTLTLITTLSP